MECELCPRRCRLKDGQRGFCFVRRRQGEAVVLAAYGRSTGFFVDPIEKKPLFHFLPGTAGVSFGAAGCNLRCRFCENWALSRTTNPDWLSHEASPEKIAARAEELGLSSVALTYNEPLVSFEMGLDVADACRARGVAAVAISSGYATAEAARAFYSRMDAVCIGLKGFTEDGYAAHAAARMAPVLRTLELIRRETRAWLELSVVLVPGTSPPAEVARRCAWIREALGADVPLHVLPFHPSFELAALPPTPAEEARRVRAIAMGEGLRHVYIQGEPNASDTRCTSCGEVVIARDAGAAPAVQLRDGRCDRCGAPLAGRFGRGSGACSGEKWEPSRWCG